MRLLAGFSLLFAWTSTVAGLGVQNAPPQRFEVASIKPCVPADTSSNARGGGAGTFINSPGSTVINCVSGAQLINRAFIMYGSQAADDPLNAWTGLNGTQFNAPTGEPLKIRGGPAWVYTNKFSIEAKAAGGADQKTMMGPMLRSLLEERFRLQLHQLTEEAPIWTLTVAKSGPKFEQAAPGGCIPVEIGKDMRATISANPGKPLCGRQIVSVKPTMSWKLGGVPVSELAAVLGQSLGTPVIDRTGLTGLFNVVFEYGPDENSAAPSIFSAVQDQLGLKLTKTQGPRGFLVIDHIERPTPDGPVAAFSDWLRPS